MKITYETALILTVIVFIGGLILLNDLFFSRRRKSVKIFEFLFFFLLFLFMILSTRNLVLYKQNEFIKEISSTQVAKQMQDEVQMYDEFGNKVGTTTIGNLIKDFFIFPVYTRESSSTPQERLRNNVVVGSVAAIYFVYWVVLLLLFEKEDVTGYHVIETEKLFEKYNPIAAACMVQNRNVMTRDMIAELLHLISVGRINLRIVPVQKEIKYRYKISENKESKYRMDMLEQEIFDIFFEDIKKYQNGVKFDFISETEDGTIEIDLIAKFDEIVLDDDLIARLKYLNELTQRRLNAIGANRQSVPVLIKLFNNFLLFISIILISFHVLSNGLEFSVNNLHIFILLYIGVAVISILPVLYALILIIYGIIRALNKSLQDITSGITGRKLIAKIASIAFATFLMIFVYAIFAHNTYAIYDILLLGATLLVVLTDDYMLKHDKSILNDYYNLKDLEEKLENTLIESENIEYMKLWNDYYPYAVALGIQQDIDEESDIPISDIRILTPEVLKNIYFVSKAHLEVMWDIDLSPAEKLFGKINEQFDITSFITKKF